MSLMPADFAAIFAALKPVFAKYEKRLRVQLDTPDEYTLQTKSPSPYPQHKGHPMFFGSVRAGKACVSFHLMPLYTCEVLTNAVSPALKKRMQGKSCFNFKTPPDAELIADLKRLTAASVKLWDEKKWL
jgi:hypothetical protein